MSPSVINSVHCINPNCPRPYPQSWEQKFCNSCGTSLRLSDRYIPLQQLGTGGFATIYTVWDTKVNREKVLKLLIETSPKAFQLFQQEAEVLASLHHPGIPQVERDGAFQVLLGNPPTRQLPALVMEKILGETLQTILDRYPEGCSETSVKNWLSQAVDILQELHQSGIIHRDIKPSNLMLRGEQLVLIDFGGAKQIGSLSPQEISSTRLFSSGYSPPEQIAGSGITPAVDFFALGRTMIHLLTGVYPADLEDPITGELRWRHIVQISPNLANLLDDMVQLDVGKRPATAREIKARLDVSVQVAPPNQDILSKVAQTSLDTSLLALEFLGKGIAKASMFLLQAVTHTAIALLDTLREMIAGGIGAAIGATIGFVLTYLTPLGREVATFLSQELPRLVPNLTLTIKPEILLFAIAGLGTAWGITAGGGFNQRRRFLVAGILGTFSYSLSWLIWQQIQTATPIGQLLVFIAVAITPLTLGLGLPSHHLVYAFVGAIATSAVFASLAALNILSTANLFHLFSLSQAPSWLDFGSSIGFFSFLSVTLVLWLGVSHYLIVPLLRWLHHS